MTKTINISKTDVIAFATVAAVIAPTFAFAEANAASNITSLIGHLKTWVGMLIPIMLSLGVLAFFWGLAGYLFGSSAEDHSKGLKRMGMGLLAIFVMASLGGLIAFMRSSLGIGANRSIDAPCIGSSCGKSGGARYKPEYRSDGRLRVPTGGWDTGN